MKLLRQRLTPTRDQDAGFTLVEVMVALFVFAILATGTAYTLLSVLAVNRDSRARHVAVNLAAEEIDLARDAASPIALADVERPARIIGTETFHVSVATEWVAATGTDDACGASDGALRYKRVNVEVTWDNRRAGSDTVRADTVITPNTRLNNPARGSILVSVKGATGRGVAGVTVSAAPASPPKGATSRESTTTDSKGCAILQGIVPGSYDVTATAPGFLDSLAQDPAPTIAVSVSAGFSAGAAFSYDRGMTLTATYAANAARDAAAHVPPLPTPSTIYLPRDLETSYVTASGAVTVTSTSTSGTTTTRSRSEQLFPFESGYQVLAGRFVPPTPGGTGGSGSAAGCVSVDPQAWPTVTAGGVTRRGVRPPAAAALPGGFATTDVPMGIVTLSGVTTSANLTAVSAVAPAATGDPGCAAPMEYSFGTVPAGATIALPYGSWTLSSGGTRVTASAVTILGAGTASGTTITLDPRAGIR